MLIILIQQQDHVWISATSDDLPSPPPVQVEWKNFPYLTVIVNASPQTVRMNDTIDVTIKITGDGYKMVKVPITVVLDMDASSSLSATNGEDGYPTRFRRKNCS